MAVFIGVDFRNLVQSAEPLELRLQILDLALWLVERFAGPQVAHKVEIALEYERRGIVWRSSISVT